MEAKGPGWALALCGRTQPSTFQPTAQAGQGASLQPSLAPGPQPSHFLLGSNCWQPWQGKTPQRDGQWVGRSPDSWEGRALGLVSFPVLRLLPFI